MIFIVKKKTASPAGYNEAVSVATFYYYNIYLLDIRGQQNGSLIPIHPCF